MGRAIKSGYRYETRPRLGKEYGVVECGCGRGFSD